MTDNRKAVYSGDRSRRVISVPNGLWAPQRCVSHTKGCKKGQVYIQVNENYGYYTVDTNAPHFDPWENIHAPCEKEHALLSAFGLAKEDSHGS